MADGPEQPQTIRDCKLNRHPRVYPRLPLRVHSAVPKGFPGTGMGNPSRPEPTAGDAVCGSDWSADRARIRLENALSSEAWRRLESAACKHGRSVEDLLLRTLEEAS
jgi:hypothetical protein